LAGFRRYLQSSGDEVARSALVRNLIRSHLAWVDAHQIPSSAPITAHAPHVASTPTGLGTAAPGSHLVEELAEAGSTHLENALSRQLLATTLGAGLGNLVPPETAEPLVTSLRRWVNDILEAGVAPGIVTAFAHMGRLTRISIQRNHLPPALSHPQSLGAWIGQRWVRATPAEIRLLPRALRLLPRQFSVALRRLGTPVGPPAVIQREAVPSLVDHQPSNEGGAMFTDRPQAVSTIALKAMEQLHAWVTTHGQHFEGHPLRDPELELFGVFEVGESVTVRVDALQGVFEMANIATSARRQIRSTWRAAGWIRSDADHLTTVKRFGGRRHRVVEIRWACWTAISSPTVHRGAIPATEKGATGALPAPSTPVPERVPAAPQGTPRDPREATSEQGAPGDTGVERA
jgi:hypothetical protein